MLFQAMAVILIVACLGTGLAGVAGAARLLYGMGRDNLLPRKFFARLDAKRNIPAFNVLVIGFLTLIGSLLISYERAAELLNFGAFLAFMGVNLTCIQQFFLRPQVGRTRNLLTDLIVPGLGFLFCLGIWCELANCPLNGQAAFGFWQVLRMRQSGLGVFGWNRRRWICPNSSGHKDMARTLLFDREMVAYYKSPMGGDVASQCLPNLHSAFIDAPHKISGEPHNSKTGNNITR